MKNGIRGINVSLTLVITMLLIAAPLTLPGERPVSASVDPGVIAYVLPNDTTGDEIHLINPNGTGDQKIWSTGKSGVNLIREVHSLTWKPGASELAFVSSFNELCSLYHEDVYTINADGTGLRRQTAPPGCGPNPGLPTGNVVLTIDNPGYDGVIFVYIQGAPKAQTIPLSPGTVQTLTFNNVMDFGNGVPQWAVGIWGLNRYTTPFSDVDVLPGKTVYGTLHLTGFDQAWSSPTYSSDGKYLAYINEPSIAYYAPSHHSTPGGIGWLWQPGGSNMSYSPSHLQWIGASPENSVLLYLGSDMSNYGFYLADHKGSTKLGEVEGSVLGFAKLPDNSGFIYSTVLTRPMDEECIFQQYGEIFAYDFNSKQTTQLTHFGPRPSQGNYNCPDGPFPYELTVSPDGSQIAFEMQNEGSWRDTEIYLDLWVANIDGSDAMELVKGGLSPSWSPGAVAKMIRFYLPMVKN